MPVVSINLSLNPARMRHQGSHLDFKLAIDLQTLAGAYKKDLMRKLPNLIYGEDSLEVDRYQKRTRLWTSTTLYGIYIKVEIVAQRFQWDNFLFFSLIHLFPLF